MSDHPMSDDERYALFLMDEGPAKCPRCGGSGIRQDRYPDGSFSPHVFKCPRCGGDGHAERPTA